MTYQAVLTPHFIQRLDDDSAFVLGELSLASTSITASLTCLALQMLCHTGVPAYHRPSAKHLMSRAVLVQAFSHYPTVTRKPLLSGAVMRFCSSHDVWGIPKCKV